jgi:hypothetical protein
MPRYIYIQIEGVEKATRVEADSFAISADKLILKKDDQQVGEFMAAKVIGWWLQDE